MDYLHIFSYVHIILGVVLHAKFIVLCTLSIIESTNDLPRTWEVKAQKFHTCVFFHAL